MKFYLFSKIEFEISDPVHLIECYCYQSDFYSKYDVIENRKIEDVNKIGARMKNKTIMQKDTGSGLELSVFTCKE